MAVELAKVALWLHTFTVGAPLSFLDHHLKCGDSLHGEPLAPVRRGLQALGTLFDAGALERLALAAQGLAQVADLTDVDIAEARQSQQLAQEAEARTAPLHRLLDFWRALRWLLPGWPVDKPAKLQKLGDDATRRALAALLAPGRNLVETLSAGALDASQHGAADAAAHLDRIGADGADHRPVLADDDLAAVDVPMDIAVDRQLVLGDDGDLLTHDGEVGADDRRAGCGIGAIEGRGSRAARYRGGRRVRGREI